MAAAVGRLDEIAPRRLPRLGRRALRRRRGRRRVRADVPSAMQLDTARERCGACLSAAQRPRRQHLRRRRPPRRHVAPRGARARVLLGRHALRVALGAARRRRRRCELLGLDQDAHFAAQFFLAPGVGPDEAAPCSVMRRRLVDHVWMEEITVTNHRHATSELHVALEVDADFADLFEVKEARRRAGGRLPPRRSLARAGLRARGFQRSVAIAASRAATITRRGFAFDAAARSPASSGRRPSPPRRIPRSRGDVRAARGRGPASTSCAAPSRPSSMRGSPALRAGDAGRGARAHLSREPQRPRRAAPAPRPRGRRDPAGGGTAVVHGAVRPRQPDRQLPGAALPARARRHDAARPRGASGADARRLPRAGAGQDPARAALRGADGARRAAALARISGRRTRRRCSSCCSTSTTAGRATTELVRELEPNARAALAWIEDSGDVDGDGYVEYARRNRHGLVNQCWKDSWDAIQFADGTLAEGRSRPARSRATSTTRAPRGAPGPRGVGRPGARRAARARAADLRGRFRRDSGCPSAAATRSRWTATSARSTA